MGFFFGRSSKREEAERLEKERRRIERNVAKRAAEDKRISLSKPPQPPQNISIGNSMVDAARRGIVQGATQAAKPEPEMKRIKKKIVPTPKSDSSIISSAASDLSDSFHMPSYSCSTPSTPSHSCSTPSTPSHSCSSPSSCSGGSSCGGGGGGGD